MALSPSEIRDWTIYRITNPNGRIYIGLTCNEKTRKNDYKYAACKEQPIIYRSILKYGWENHEHSTIDSFSSTLEFAQGKEIFWVRSYMSNVRKYSEQKGMNLNDGGGSNYGLKHSEEAKKKMSLANKGRKHTEASKKIMSEWRKGKNFYWPNEETKKKMSAAAKGRKLSNETKIKLSKSCMGRPSPNKDKPMSQAQREKYHKPILVYSLDSVLIRECPSVKSTSQEFKVSKNTVRGIAAGVIKSPTKFIFKYK